MGRGPIHRLGDVPGVEHNRRGSVPGRPVRVTTHSASPCYHSSWNRDGAWFAISNCAVHTRERWVSVMQVRLSLSGEELTRCRQVVCCSCSKSDVVSGVAICTKSGRPITIHIHGSPCPKGKQADGLGRIRWCGFAWVGVPYPVRVWKWATSPKGVRVPLSDWLDTPGCGCMIVAKRLWLWLRS